jgi:hypothetical protein
MWNTGASPGPTSPFLSRNQGPARTGSSSGDSSLIMFMIDMLLAHPLSPPSCWVVALLSLLRSGPRVLQEVWRARAAAAGRQAGELTSAAGAPAAPPASPQAVPRARSEGPRPQRPPPDAPHLGFSQAHQGDKVG